MPCESRPSDRGLLLEKFATVPVSSRLKPFSIFSKSKLELEGSVAARFSVSGFGGWSGVESSSLVYGANTEVLLILLFAFIDTFYDFCERDEDR